MKAFSVDIVLSQYFLVEPRPGKEILSPSILKEPIKALQPPLPSTVLPSLPSFNQGAAIPSGIVTAFSPRVCNTHLLSSTLAIPFTSPPAVLSEAHFSALRVAKSRVPKSNRFMVISC